MKYKVLTPQEIETYKIGYAVGHRDMVITDIEWDSEEEHKIYRKGYMAGLMDYKRNVSNVSNVSEVNNVDIITPTTPISISISKGKSNNINNNNNNNNTTRVEKNQVDNQVEKKEKFHNALEVFGNAFKGTDAVVGIFDRPDGSQREGIQIKNPHLMAFVRQRFDKKTLNKVSDWAIDHNQRGHTYNATALIKLLCKFQSNIEPTINFNQVQAEYLTFEPQR